MTRSGTVTSLKKMKWRGTSSSKDSSKTMRHSSQVCVGVCVCVDGCSLFTIVASIVKNDVVCIMHATLHHVIKVHEGSSLYVVHVLWLRC